MNSSGAPLRGFAFSSPGEGQVRALAMLSLAAAAGVATQALFFGAGLGLNFFVWNYLAVAASLVVFRRGRIGTAAWGAALASVLLGFSIVRLASPWSLTIALPADAMALGALPLLLSESIELTELGQVPLRLVRSLAHVPRAAHAVTDIPGSAIGDDGIVAARATLRGLLIGVPTAALFALLLSVDDSFRSALSWLANGLGDATRFATYSALTAGGYLVVTVHRLRRRADAAGAEGPSRTAATDGRSSGAGRVSTTSWSVVIGLVSLVFAVFVVSNLHLLFGGVSAVRSPGGATYAAYLHSGFALLLFATILSVGVVLAGHTLLGSSDGETGPRVPGGAALSFLETTLLVLTAITLASCWQRLLVYEDAYGASRLRMGVLVVQVGVLGLLLLTAGKAVFREWRGYGAGVVILATVIAVVASHLDADRAVAVRNLDRAAKGWWLDEAYLSSLSRDAGAALTHPVVARDPELKARLSASWCSPRRGDWREYRGMGRCGP